MKTKKFLALLLVIFLCGCSSDEPLANEGQDKPDKEVCSIRTPEEVTNYVQMLVDEIDKQNPSRGVKRRLVEGVSAVSYEHSKIASRVPINGYTGHIRKDTIFYIVNFVDSSGFAFAGALPESEPVYAIMDNGNLNWSDLEKPEIQKRYFRVLDFVNVGVLGSSGGFFPEGENIVAHIKGWDVLSAKAPILKTAWDQHEPYSRFCPNNTVGCVAVATAQLLSYFRTIERFPNYRTGYTVLDWDNVISKCNQNKGGVKGNTEEAIQIADLCRYIGRCIDADYKNDGSTSADSNKALDFLKSHCFLKTSGLKGYDESMIVSSLRNGVPVYGRGNSSRTKFLFWDVSYGGGHAWVYDGFVICRESGDTSFEKKVLLHCNWGWGGDKNGYFLSKVFDSSLAKLEDGDIPVDMSTSRSDDGGQRGNYRYNLEYATIWK